MARPPITTDLITNDPPVRETVPAQEASATPEHPREGGSYRRDPQTGALTLVEQTKPATAAGKNKE